jgi:hypothetical protein
VEGVQTCQSCTFASLCPTIAVPLSAKGSAYETRYTMLLRLPPMPDHDDGPGKKNGPARAGLGADAVAREIATLPE